MSGHIDEAEVARIAKGLTEAHRRMICAFDSKWRYPREVGVTPGALSWRDETLLERLSAAACNPYRLTPLGLAVRKHLEANNAG